MVLLDETVVGVALPTIQRDLHLSQNGLQWVVNAYLLALASFRRRARSSSRRSASRAMPITSSL
jgi:hypothetical protein